MNVDLCVKRKFKKGTSILLEYTGHKLAEAIGAYIRTPKKLPSSNNHHLLNWGRTTITDLPRYINTLNYPSAVEHSVDKLKSLAIFGLHGVNSIEFTSNKEEALSWSEAGYWVVCRTLLKASGGKGIVLAKTAEEVVSAPLYTKYFIKNKEFRYHIFQGRVIDIQQKKRLSDAELEARGFTERPPSYIRNLANGYIFARENIHFYPEVASRSIKAVECLGLDFGAVDILVNTDDHDNFLNCAVCEVNTAPGLTGATFDIYVSVLKEYYEEIL